MNGRFLTVEDSLCCIPRPAGYLLHGDEYMEKYLLAPLLIQKLEKDDDFLIGFSRLLKALAVACAVAAVIVFFLGWKDLFDMSSEGMIGGIIYQLTFAIASYFVVHFTLIRAGEIKQAASGRSAAVWVSSVVLKLAGEAWGVASALLGCGAAVYLWFAGREARVLLDKTAVFFPFLKAGPASFAAGMALIFQGILYGALAILIGYLLAEILRLLPVRSGAKEAVLEKG